MKQEFTEYLHNLNEGVLNGEKNALEVYVELKGIEKLFTAVLKGVYIEAIEEAEKYGKGEQKAFGIKFQVKNGATRWDFSPCQEHTVKKLELKALEDRLKSLAKSKLENIVDGDTGEIMELPIKKQNANSLTIKF